MDYDEVCECEEWPKEQFLRFGVKSVWNSESYWKDVEIKKSLGGCVTASNCY